MSLPQIQLEAHQVTKQLQEGCIIRESASEQQYVLKPVASFCDASVAEFLHQVFHPGLPRCFGETYQPDNLMYYVFEYRTGIPLDQWCRPQSEKAPDVQQLLNLMIQWGQILSFLHSGQDASIIHCDVKPSNLIVSEKNEAVLIDFGSARKLDGQSNSELHLKNQTGTPLFAPPELLRGDPHTTGDLYALGLTLLVQLTQQSPEQCQKTPLKRLLPDHDPKLLRILGICLHTDPEQRYCDADQFVHDLKEITAENPVIEAAARKRKERVFNRSKLRPIENQAPQNEGLDSQQTDRSIRAPMLCVWGQSSFGCELACAASITRNVLVIDAHLLHPEADLLLGKPKQACRTNEDGSAQGIDLTASPVEWITPQAIQAFARETAQPKVRLLQCVNQVEDYAHCKVETLSRVVQTACLLTELLVVLCDRSIFDAYACYSLLTADQVVVPVRGDIASLRAVNQSVAFLIQQYHFQTRHLHYIAFDHNRSTDLSVGTMNELCGGHLTACITQTPDRRSRQYASIPYAARMNAKNVSEYNRLVRQLSIDSL